MSLHKKEHFTIAYKREIYHPRITISANTASSYRINY